MNKYISSLAQKSPPAKINGELKPSKSPTYINGIQPQSPTNGWENPNFSTETTWP
jgi:hypothetical protein